MTYIYGNKSTHYTTQESLTSAGDMSSRTRSIQPYLNRRFQGGRHHEMMAVVQSLRVQARLFSHVVDCAQTFTIASC